MKKIFISILAIAALAACAKTGVEYDEPAEIGFSVVAGNITKAVVDGTTFPTGLNMYVFAETNDNTADASDYINNALFSHKGKANGTSVEVWGGATKSYYWPNVKTLHFAGYSASGNATAGTYNWNTGVLSISGYTPGEGTGEGANDLMWFPSTALKRAAGYSKADKYVDVDMYHTCAWITFIVKGDNVTSGSYKVTAMSMTEIDKTADVTCSATASTTDDATTVTPNIVWTNNTNKTGNETKYTVPVVTGGVVLNTTGLNVETNAVYPTEGNTTGNIVIIPQVPGKLNLSYTYKSSTDADIVENVEGLDLKITETATDANNKWEPGKHYIYTITIKANEILIAPTPVDWDDQNWFVTVE